MIADAPEMLFYAALILLGQIAHRRFRKTTPESWGDEPDIGSGYNRALESHLRIVTGEK